VNVLPVRSSTEAGVPAGLARGHACPGPLASLLESSSPPIPATQPRCKAPQATLLKRARACVGWLVGSGRAQRCFWKEGGIRDIEQMEGGEDVPSLLVLACQNQTYQPRRSMLDRRHNFRTLEVNQRQAFLWFVRGNVVGWE